MGATEIYTDTAGGSLEGGARGSGGVCREGWFFIPWSLKVNGGAWKVDGKKVGRKLTALELVGPLAALAVFARECRMRPVKIWVDNAGSVGVWNKGYSNDCKLSSSVVRAISVVAAGLGCKVDILKVTRCSSPGTRMLDLISKGDLAGFFETAGEQGTRMEHGSHPGGAASGIHEMGVPAGAG